MSGFPDFGPDSDFFTKMVGIWSGILSKVQIFQKIAKITHEIGFFWHLLNETANINFRMKVLESLDFSTESGFLMQMVRIFEKIGLDLVWSLILLVWNLNWRHCIPAERTFAVHISAPGG